MTSWPTRRISQHTAPAAEPLTLAEAKLYARVDGSDDDALITQMIVAARDAAQMFLGKSLVTQSWLIAYNDAAPDEVPLPYGPVTSITSVSSISRTGVITPVNAAIYYINAARDTLLFDSQATGHRIEIVYSAGYGDATQVPAAIKQGLLAHVAAMVDARETLAAIPAGAVQAYRMYREVAL